MATITHKPITHKRRIALRQRRRSGTRIARTVLMISFIILLGRFAYSAIGAFLSITRTHSNHVSNNLSPQRA